MKKSSSSEKNTETKERVKKERKSEKLTRGERRREAAAAVLVVLGLAAFLGISALVQRVFIPLGYYNKATRLMKNGSYIEAGENFKKAGDFSDSAEKIVECKDLQTEKDYNDAIALYEEGKYDAAMKGFEKLFGYSSAKLYYRKAQYGRGGEYLKAGEYDLAKADFEAVTDLGDAPEMVKECDYQKAGALYAAGSLAESVELYNGILEYKDAAVLARNVLAEYHFEQLKTAEVGSTVYFGRYEQDGIADNGEEDLEWIVLERTDSAVMLISKYLLAEQKMNAKKADDSIQWAGTTLRTWCNSTFYNNAFVDKEKNVILTSTVSATKNTSSGLAGAATEDKVFILSLEEVRKYFPTEEERMTAPTAQAVADGLFRFSEGTSFWWLRTRGASNWQFTYFSAVNNFGFIDYTRGISYDSTDVGVRPVIWVSTAE